MILRNGFCSKLIRTMKTLHSRPSSWHGEGERAAPLAGAGLGGEALDAELLVVPGLRDGGVGLVAARRARRSRSCSRSSPGSRGPARGAWRGAAASAASGQRISSTASGMSIQRSVRHLLLDEVHREHGGERVRADRLSVRSQRRRRRLGQVGGQVVPLAGHVLEREQDLRIAHWVRPFRDGHMVDPDVRDGVAKFSPSYHRRRDWSLPGGPDRAGRPVACVPVLVRATFR